MIDNSNEPVMHVLSLFAGVGPQSCKRITAAGCAAKRGGCGGRGGRHEKGTPSSALPLPPLHRRRQRGFLQLPLGPT